MYNPALQLNIEKQIEQKWSTDIELLKKEHKNIGIQSIRALLRINEYRQEGARFGATIALEEQWIDVKEIGKYRYRDIWYVNKTNTVRKGKYIGDAFKADTGHTCDTNEVTHFMLYEEPLPPVPKG